MRATVKVNGAITVVNAIASWRGAAIGLDFEVVAEAEPFDSLAVLPDDPLLREAASVALEEVGGEGVRVKVDSEIPVGWGLKSSSAVANATVLAVLALFKREVNLMKALKLSVNAARRAGVTITGALDDAAASMLGGLVVTDNSKDELLLRIPVPEYEVLILLPEGEAKPTITVDATRLRKFSSIASSLVELLPKKIWEVMTLNGLLYSEVLGYDPKPALKAVEIGAIGAGLSGTGPAIAAVCEECDEIAEEWSSLGRVFRKKITNQMAEIRRS
ncbi:MAG: shikimate kinase [Candidatus Korarchaeota archaeon]|nr:shikimate kinase [Candidatus Korarchaeota archaeon]